MSIKRLFKCKTYSCNKIRTTWRCLRYLVYLLDVEDLIFGGRVCLFYLLAFYGQIISSLNLIDWKMFASFCSSNESSALYWSALRWRRRGRWRCWTVWTRQGLVTSTPASASRRLRGALWRASLAGLLRLVLIYGGSVFLYSAHFFTSKFVFEVYRICASSFCIFLLFLFPPIFGQMFYILPTDRWHYFQIFNKITVLGVYPHQAE